MSRRFLSSAAALVIVQLCGCTRPPAPEPIPAPPPVDRVVVVKHERRMYLMRGDETLHTYTIALGWQPEGGKVMEGDGKTPEGRYVIDGRNPDSRFHLSLHISYPDEVDLARAEAEGVSTGGAIVIHGAPNGEWQFTQTHQGIDWTEGCIAVSDEEIEEIWGAVADGTPIDIIP